MILLDFITLFIKLKLLDFADIFLVAIILYFIYNLIKGTAAFNIFIGIFSIYVIWQIVKALEMNLLSNILEQLISVGVIALIIIFQPEIRQFLLLLGSPKFIQKNRKAIWLVKWLQKVNNIEPVNPLAIDEIVQAAESMSKTKTGALIVLTQKSVLTSVLETGDSIDGEITKRLIENIFFKNTPMHDGAMIISDNRIKAARCVLPITKNPDFPAHMGLRHRASVGITEQSDAVAIVVSEETGSISFSKEGKIFYNINIAKLKKLIENEFLIS
ncbi:MAG: diadenylate cyclase CdaA [Bacteroidota bacterium]